ncbi:MAG: methylmalonate-semialdehyde dehydrogenase (CoA acylating) [Rickettsiales bacterium]|nr:methylmalonate-semialdehyde dehydrogenase (CoA acylating) [Rickettsiales bacterium]
MKTIGHRISGKVIEPKESRYGDVYNPATGDVEGKVALASIAEVNQAVESAKNSLPEWSAMPPIQRARILFKYKELIEQNIDELADLVGREHGKTLTDAKGSVIRGLEVVEFACGIPHLLKGEFTEQVGTGVDSFSMRQPVGIAAGITPFNFPAMVPLWMYPIAIACGNTFILKPSERDPSCPLRLAELLEDAGAPPGVLNVVNGDKEAVNAILDHQDISAVSFVGSTPVAQHVYSRGALSGKRVQALGGAKNHMVIMPDADLDQAVDALMGAAYGSAGERCMAISVAVAVGDIGDKLIEKMAPKVSALKVGPWDDPEAEMGPIVTREAFNRITNLIDEGEKSGADLVVDGRNLKLQGYENGYFMGGSLFDNVKPGMPIYDQEIFGPVLSTVRVPDYEQALNLVKSNPYGNGVSIFTRDGDSARDFASKANIGMVGINIPIPVPVAYHSFGGWKDSLFGSNNAHGMDGVRFYTRIKTISSRWPSGIKEGALFTMPLMK